MYQACDGTHMHLRVMAHMHLLVMAHMHSAFNGTHGHRHAYTRSTGRLQADCNHKSICARNATAHFFRCIAGVMDCCIADVMDCFC